MKFWHVLALSLPFFIGCAAQPGRTGLQLGSATSKNIFVDASQFGNRIVKVRLRNSSGDPSVNMAQLRSEVESGLRSAGFQVSDQGFGIVLDVNLYFLNSVAVGRRQATNEVGILLGGVAGYEMARRPGGVAAGSGAVLGAIAGATLQEVIRNSNEYDSYLALCDVNIGVIKQESRRKDFFVIGGNRLDKEQDEPNGTFESFALRETVKVSVYGGEARERRAAVYEAIQGRLARVIANLI